MNRDHWTKPYQSNGRDAHGYGNSGPIEPMRRTASGWAFDYALTAVVIFLFVITAVSL